MRYSTNPGRDLRRMCVWLLVAVVGVYLFVALIPFGLSTEPTISNRAGLSASDLESLLVEVRKGWPVREAREVYFDTMLRPWERMHYGHSIEVEGGPRRCTVTMTSDSPNGSMWIHCPATKVGQGWEVARGQSVMQY